jgi:hypothetical protein
MIDKKKIKEEYKRMIPAKGVFMIKNNKSGKVFLGSTLNLYNILERSRFILNMGCHENEHLQKDWNISGEKSFSFEILETLQLKDDTTYNYDEDLKILEMIWIDRFKPLKEKCYNESERIRTV